MVMFDLESLQIEIPLLDLGCSDLAAEMCQNCLLVDLLDAWDSTHAQ